MDTLKNGPTTPTPSTFIRTSKDHITEIDANNVEQIYKITWNEPTDGGVESFIDGNGTLLLDGDPRLDGLNAAAATEVVAPDKEQKEGGRRRRRKKRRKSKRKSKRRTKRRRKSKKRRKTKRKTKRRRRKR